MMGLLSQVIYPLASTTVAAKSSLKTPRVPDQRSMCLKTPDSDGCFLVFSKREARFPEKAHFPFLRSSKRLAGYSRT